LYPTTAIQCWQTQLGLGLEVLAPKKAMKKEQQGCRAACFWSQPNGIQDHWEIAILGFSDSEINNLKQVQAIPKSNNKIDCNEVIFPKHPKK